MCRNFPAGSKILRIKEEMPEGVAATAAQTPGGSYSVALVNFGSQDREISLNLPEGGEGYSLQFYGEGLPHPQSRASCFRPELLLYLRKNEKVICNYSRPAGHRSPDGSQSDAPQPYGERYGSTEEQPGQYLGV